MMRYQTIALAAALVAAGAPAPVRAAQPQIVYESWAASNPDVWVMNADGSGAQPLTTEESGEQGPVWSPDGSRIAFFSDRDGDAEIYTMARDGSDVRQLTHNNTSESYPVWGPTGKIAYVQLAFTPVPTGLLSAGTLEIWVMNPDGSSQTRLTNNTWHDAYPAWTPDGRLLFASQRPADGSDVPSLHNDIYRMDPDGTRIERLTGNDCEDRAPSSSPDGMKIAFASDCGRIDIGVHVMNADGSSITPLTTNADHEDWPTWSPDGTQLVFASTRDAGTLAGGDIVVINADGSAPHNLTRTVDTFEGLPWFSPAGTFDEVGRGHIAIGNVAADTRTITVLGRSAARRGTPSPDQGIDGFFLNAPPAGTSIGTWTTDRGGAGFALNLNFHDAAGIWLGFCSPPWSILDVRPAVEVRGCTVPAGAHTVEVSADHGVDLDVVVRRETA